MLVDAQHLRANGRLILPRTALQAPQKIALHGRRPDPFPAPQAAPIDAIEVLLEDHLLEALTGPLERLHARQLLPKGAPAVQTHALANPQIHHAAPEPPVVVPYHPPAPALVSQARPFAVGARYRSGIPGRYRDRAAAAFDVANLVLGQRQDNLRVGQNVFSQECFTTLGPRTCPR